MIAENHVAGIFQERLIRHVAAQTADGRVLNFIARETGPGPAHLQTMEKLRLSYQEPHGD